VGGDDGIGVELLHASTDGELAVEALGEHIFADTLEVVGVASENTVVRITTGRAVHCFAGGTFARVAVAVLGESTSGADGTTISGLGNS